MRMWFHWSAAMQLMRRRKGPVFRMVIVSLIGSVWCIAGGAWIIATWRNIDDQAKQVELSIFLQPGTSTESALQFKATVMSMPGVMNARYKSAEELWDEFAKDVGAGQELMNVVDMPTMVSATLTAKSISYAQLSLMANAISHQYPDVVKEIVWPKELVSIIDSRRRDVSVLGIAAGILSIVMFSIALSYAFRAEIHRAGPDLAIGTALGADPNSIAAPHLIVSLISGFAGLLFGFIISFIAINQGTQQVRWLSSVNINDISLIGSALAVPGVVVCLWQSIAAARSAERKGI